jgi:hypothetical protein
MWIGRTCSCKYWKSRRGIADKHFLLEGDAVSEDKGIPLFRSHKAAWKPAESDYPMKKLCIPEERKFHLCFLYPIPNIPETVFVSSICFLHFSTTTFPYGVNWVKFWRISTSIYKEVIFAQLADWRTAVVGPNNSSLYQTTGSNTRKVNPIPKNHTQILQGTLEYYCPVCS